MSKQPTTQVINSTDQKWLEEVQSEAEQYRGLSTSLSKGRLVINLIDSEKHRRKNRVKKKPDYDDDYDDYAPQF